MRVKPDRRLVATAVLVCWAIGLGWLALRRHDVPYAERLAQGALRLEPGTYFYNISQNGRIVGWASSSLDTSAAGFTTRDAAHIRTLIAGDTQSVVATSGAHLTRAFVLLDFGYSVSGDAEPWQGRQVLPAGSDVLLPSLAPVAMMVSNEPRVGAALTTHIFNPLSRRAESVTLRIAAESLYSVVDSAVFDAARNTWAVAHIDTVRSWQIVTESHAISAWVDSRGRIVAASEPGGLSLVRSTYEIATLNPKLKNP